MLAPPLTILSVCDWAILSKIPLMDSSWLNRLSARFSTCLRLRSDRRACRTDGGRQCGGSHACAAMSDAFAQLHAVRSLQVLQVHN